MDIPRSRFRSGHEIRTNLTITDRQGLTVSLNERGPQLEKAEVDRLEKAVQKNLDGAAWLMLCGSLPPGVPVEFLRAAHRYGAPEESEDAARYRRRCAARGHRGRAHGGLAQSARSRAPAEPGAGHAQSFPGRGGAHPRHGPGDGGALARQPGRRGSDRRRHHRSHSAARGSALPHRRGRCPGGGFRLVHGTRRRFHGCAALGRGCGNGFRHAARPAHWHRSSRPQEVYQQVEVRRIE